MKTKTFTTQESESILKAVSYYCLLSGYTPQQYIEEICSLSEQVILEISDDLVQQSKSTLKAEQSNSLQTQQ